MSLLSKTYAPSILLSRLVVAFTLRQRTRGLSSITVTCVISLLIGKYMEPNINVQAKNMAEKVNVGIKRMESAAENSFL